MQFITIIIMYQQLKLILYSSIELLRLTNGTTLTQSFGAREPLSAVGLFAQFEKYIDN